MSSAAVSSPINEAFRRLESECDQGSVSLSRYRCRYLTWGEGPPLVLIHGLADRSQSFTMLMAHLSRQFRCIAYDQPVGGEDAASLAGYTHDLLLADLQELLAHLGVGQTHLLGHSFGSTLMLKALARDPQRFGRGVSICGFAHRPLSRPERMLAWMGGWIPGRLRHLPLRMKAMKRAHSWSFDGLEPERWESFHKVTGDTPIAAMARWAQQLHRTDVGDALPAIQQPVLLIAGEQDMIVRREHQDRLLENLPNAALFQIAQCGHFPLWTHPQIVADAVRRFLGDSGCERQGCGEHLGCGSAEHGSRCGN